MKLKRIDSISMDQTYYTDEGYLVDHPIVTTCGIFEYKNDDGSTRRELRLPENVFDKKSLESYKGKPIIITHDAGEVDKENVRREQIGTIMSEGYRDGDSVRCEIIIHDTNALKSCGLKELSDRKSTRLNSSSISRREIRLYSEKYRNQSSCTCRRSKSGRNCSLEYRWQG